VPAGTSVHWRRSSMSLLTHMQHKALLLSQPAAARSCCCRTQYQQQQQWQGQVEGHA
jgi:hypothetical protein